MSSRELIVQAATELLDAGGESALTLRALTVRLSTGYGAIYHHVADKGDVLAAATDDVITRVLSGTVTDTDPRETLRRLALGLFDAIDAHPWVGAELSRQPWRPALLDFYESIGSWPVSQPCDSCPGRSKSIVGALGRRESGRGGRPLIP